MLGVSPNVGSGDVESALHYSSGIETVAAAINNVEQSCETITLAESHDCVRVLCGRLWYSGTVVQLEIF